MSVRIRDRYAGGETVTSVVPGHERTGEELVADELIVEDGLLALNWRAVDCHGVKVVRVVGLSVAAFPREALNPPRVW